MKIRHTMMPMVAAVLVTACGGGSSSSSSELTSELTGPNSGSNGSTTETSEPNEPNESTSALTGRFVDSAVTGLEYTTATQSGKTLDGGAFNYLAGEEIVFSIGGIELPAVEAAEVITPLSVFGTTEITDIRVMNLARLLQTLDTDGDVNNGITISDSAEASAQGLELDFASNTFEDDVVNLVANSESSNTSLVDSMKAIDHLQETLFVEGFEERPAPPADVAIDANTSATHPLVGRSAEFTDNGYDISGTLTVIDDRTLQITNFNYNAQGVSVFFYTGLDGDFRNGEAIGTRLNGVSQPYDNSTITLTLPDNLTLDDVNGLSVWCVPFNFDFGSAQL